MNSSPVATSTRLSALSRINRLPITAYHRRLATILGLVFFFDMADINTFAFAAPAIMKQWHISISSIGTLVSATFIGMFVGATAGGWLSDQIGRKRALVLTTLWYASFSLLNAFAWNTMTLFTTRLLTGVGISAMTVVGIAYISEIYPARVRGSFQGWIMVIGLMGVPVTAYIARFVIPLGSWGWRLVFVWGALGMVFPLFAGALEESPRWLENHGRFDEADAALDRIERRIGGPVASLPATPFEISPPAASTWRQLVSSSYVGRTALLIAVWTFATLGFFGFTSWVPTLLVVRGFSLVHSLAWSSAMSLATIPGALLAALFSDRLDRKWSITAVTIIIAICGLFYGNMLHATGIVLFGLLVEMFIHLFMPLMYAYTAESFPSDVRNSGTGLAYGSGRLANIVGPLVIAFLFKHYGYRSVFVYISLTWAVVAVLIGLMGARSRRLA